MAKAVWKYPAAPPDATALYSSEWALEMPVGATILFIEVQYGQPKMWAEVDAETDQYEIRRFKLVGTGHAEIESGDKYIGSFLVNGGVFVFHVYEVVKE